MPTICVVILLLVIFFITLTVIFKKRHLNLETVDNNNEQISSIDDRMLSMMDPRKESYLSPEKCKTPKKLYYPSPYATNHLTNQIEIKSNCHLNHSNLDSNEIPSTFERLILDHTYDIPFPPKWV